MVNNEVQVWAVTLSIPFSNINDGDFDEANANMSIVLSEISKKKKAIKTIQFAQATTGDALLVCLTCVDPPNKNNPKSPKRRFDF